MTRTEAQLTRDIMLRVRAVYLMRLVANPETAKGAVLGLCCLSVVYMVSIPDIMGNMSQLPSMIDGAAYLFAAFLHTSFVVESAIVLAFLAGLWLAYDIARAVPPFIVRRLWPTTMTTVE